MLTVRVESAVKDCPGRTATQIAEALFGSNGYGEQVRPTCAVLIAMGRIERRGRGGPGDPYRYFPAE